MLGVLFSLISATCFSLSNVLVRRGVVFASASVGAFITVLLGVPMFAAGALVFGQLFNAGQLSLWSYVLLAGAGVIHFVVGRFFNYAAIGAIGATRTAPIQAMNLPYSIVVAFLFLDEGITLGMGVAIALIVVGPLLIIERRPAVTVELASSSSTVAIAAAPARLRQTEGYLFALLSAVAYGTSPVLIRAALEGHSSLSIFGGLVSYTAAALVLLASLVLPQRHGLLKAITPQTLRVFFWAAFAVFLAQMFRFIALSEASVAVVATLMRCGAIITLGLSWYMNRSLENITRRVVAGVVVSVLGAVLLVATQP